MNILVKREDGTAVALSQEQFEVAQPIILDMMNGKLSVKKAEPLIRKALQEAGLPL